MKKNIAKKWIDALRSGKYKQIKGALKRAKDNQIESFCALGVLCDLYQKDHKEKLEEQNSHIKKTKNGSAVAFEDEIYTLPFKVQKWAGMKDSEGCLDLDGEQDRTIPQLNDQGVSFKKIADLIEKNQKKL